MGSTWPSRALVVGARWFFLASVELSGTPGAASLSNGASLSRPHAAALNLSRSAVKLYVDRAHVEGMQPRSCCELSTVLHRPTPSVGILSRVIMGSCRVNDA